MRGWRGWVVLAAGAALALVARAGEAQTVRIGVLKLTTSAPIFAGVEKGYFRDEGITPDLKWFAAAAPIATALASGDLDVGATGLTAALYNAIAGGSKMYIVADKGRHRQGFQLTGLLAAKAAHDAGLRSVRDLKGKKVGITTIGSTFHYVIGNLLEQEGMSLGDVSLAPLRTLQSLSDALRTGQIQAALLPSPFSGAAIDEGFGVPLLWADDRLPYQIAAVFYAEGLAKRRDLGVRFMKAYVRSARYYHDAALVMRDGKRVPGKAFDELIDIIRKYTGQENRQSIVGAIPYQDRDGTLLAEDIGRQIKWYVAHQLMERDLDPTQVVDTSFHQEALRLVGDK